MEAFPDPRVATLAQARAFFQSTSPSRFVLRHVESTITENHANWNIKYTSVIAIDISNLASVRSTFQNTYAHSCARIGRVSITREEDIPLLWNITFQHQPPTRKESDKVKTSKKEHSSHNQQDKNEDIFQVTVKTPQGMVLKPIDDVQDNDCVCRLYHNGHNVTRRYTSRGSLCKNIFMVIKQHVSKGIDYVRSLLQKSKRHKRTNKLRPGFGYDGKIEMSARSTIDFIPATVEEVVPEVKTTSERRSYSAVAGDYHQWEAVRESRVLSDPRIFRVVRQYLGMHLVTVNGVKYTVSPEWSPSYPTSGRFIVGISELKNILVTSGLPLDKSLFDKFQRYCKERNIIDNVVHLVEDLARARISIIRC